MFEIRPYHPSDLTALYVICLQTADSGNDGTPLFANPYLPGHVYAAPYAVFEPELCLMLSRAHKPVGYVLGARDSYAFGERCEREWFPPLRQQMPLPPVDDTSTEANFTRALHRGHRVQANLPDYPAHLHIDLLPLAQGQGWGTKMMHAFVRLLRQQGVSGVHLGVGARNTGGIAFYRRYGFAELAQQPWGLQFGLKV